MVRLCAIFFLGFQGFILPSASAQSNAPVSVGPAEHIFDNAQVIRQKPSLFLYGDALNQDEMHILDRLTPQEIKRIEEAVEPPAIGMVRDLKSPVRFTLNSGDIPEQGVRTVSGGRLARINADTLVWTTYIKSEQAEELRIFFSEGNFPAGVLVNLFSKDNYAFHQAELTGRVNENGFYTTTTFADYVYLQVVIPVKVMGENLYFVIPKVVHANHRPVPDAPNVDCFEDVNCAYANSYANIGMLKGATAQLTFVVGASYYICTGGLLNDVRAVDWQPFLLTANHCFSTQASAASLEARFDMFTTSCNGPTNPSILLVNGSNLIATNSQSDFTMVLLNNNPGGVRWYLGWSAGGVGNDVTVHSVNHPSGTPQKYQRALNKTAPDFSCGGLSTANFHYTRALGGESVGGSSGGNLCDPGGYVIGQLYGWCYLEGATECNYPTFYNVWGKFEVSYSNNNLQYWLYGGGSSVYMTTSPAASYDFGTGNVGSNYYTTVTVTNDGYAPYYLNLESGSAYITGADAGQFAIIGNSYLYLSPGASGNFTVRFSPTSAGLKTANLNIPHNANNTVSPRVITLTGSAEPCSDIISLAGGGAVNAKTYSKSGTGIWYTSWNTPCNYPCPGQEQVYSFVAPYTGYYSIEVTSTNYYYVDYMWKADVCDGTIWNCIDDIAFTGTYGSLYWTAGSTYYILADAESTALSTQTFFIFLNPCLNTIPIAGTGAGNSVTFTGGGDGGWFTGGPSPCGYYCPGGEQVYSFVAPYSGYYSITVSDASSWVDYMWSTYCGSTGWNCIDDIYYPGTAGAMYWDAGTTYYILLDDEDTYAGSHTFYINPPDPCIGIVPIVCGQAIEFPGGGTGVWDTYACGYTCPGGERIYSFVAPTTGQYSLQVNASGSWVDYMWSTSCSGGVWNCISDVWYPGQYGSMFWTAGTTYYILADDEDYTAGIHSFNIICPELCHTCPIYDFQIAPYNWWQTQSSSHDVNGCKNYRFYAYSGYHYTFKTGCGDGATADFDTYLELFDEGCVFVTYDDDGCGYPLSKLEWSCTTSGYYTLKVRGYGGAGGNFTMAYITCYYPPAQPGYISGPSTVVNGTSRSFSIDAVAEATSYTWTYSGGGVPSGTGTTCTLAPTSDGILSVVANNGCGSSPASDFSITVIPENLDIQNIAVNPGTFECYAAGLTITVAGGGSFFFVPNGASAEFVAGQNILFMPGVLVQNGGYLLGRITTDDTYCNYILVKSGEKGEQAGTILPFAQSGDVSFKVYPNPTTGNFTLELSSEPAGSPVKVQCYSLLGSLIMEKEFNTGKRHEFNLTDQMPGLYLLKVTQASGTGMQKIIRQ